MLAIQEKKLKEAIAILSLLGAKYKVVIARDISSYGCQNFGTKSVSTLADREANTVEVFALKDLG
jgi:hypothetical protein